MHAHAGVIDSKEGREPAETQLGGPAADGDAAKEGSSASLSTAEQAVQQQNIFSGSDKSASGSAAAGGDVDISSVSTGSAVATHGLDGGGGSASSGTAAAEEASARGLAAADVPAGEQGDSTASLEGEAAAGAGGTGEMTLPLGEGEREEGEGSGEEEEGDGDGDWEGEWDEEGPLLNYYGSTFEELVPDPDAPAYLPPSRKGRRPTREDKGTWKGNERALEEVRAPDNP